MYFDLEDYRPDTPHLSSAITVRESVLISLLAHAVLVIVWLVMPEANAASPDALAPVAQQQESVQFVHMVPRRRAHGAAQTERRTIPISTGARPRSSAP